MKPRPENLKLTVTLTAALKKGTWDPDQTLAHASRELQGVQDLYSLQGTINAMIQETLAVFLMQADLSVKMAELKALEERLKTEEAAMPKTPRNIAVQDDLMDVKAK